jgi:hypothetical protein
MSKIGHGSWLEVNLNNGDTNNFKQPLEFTANIKQVKNLTFDDAADYTIKLISEKYNNLYLPLSGGLDSEFVAKTLLKNNISFTPVILQFINSTPESWYAFKFCDENKLTPKIIDLTNEAKLNLFAKRLLKIASTMNFPAVTAVFSVVLSDMFPNAQIITGAGEVLPTSWDYQMQTNRYHDEELDGFMFLQHPLELAFGDAHPGAFFSYTPEILLASIKDFDYTTNSQVAKAKLYGLLPRPKIDITGYHRQCNQEIRNAFAQSHKILDCPDNYKYFVKSRQDWLKFLGQ